jgi:hypothetical protein
MVVGERVGRERWGERKGGGSERVGGITIEKENYLKMKI